MEQIVRHGHYFFTDNFGSDITPQLYQILDLPTAAFDRYDNPFEQKWALREKFGHAEIGRLLLSLELMLPTVAEMFDVSLEVDHLRHYAGIFKYNPGDRLDVHVDAGIHPKTGKRKHVTAVLYFGAGAGPLEFWRGDNCTDHDPEVYESIAEIEPTHGALVFFENNDRAWHGTRMNDSSDPRVVATVSYLSDQVEAFKNKRQRAFFVPRPGEYWDDKTYDLRNKRASSDNYAQVYRAGAPARAM